MELFIWVLMLLPESSQGPITTGPGFLLQLSKAWSPQKADCAVCWLLGKLESKLQEEKVTFSIAEISPR